jgi:hypothetical protein
MNLASRLHEVLVVEEVHGYQWVGAEPFRKHDRFLYHIPGDQVCHNDIPSQLEGHGL